MAREYQSLRRRVQTRWAILTLLILLVSTNANGQTNGNGLFRKFAKISRLQSFYDGAPRLYWISPDDRTIFEYYSRVESAQKSIPIIGWLLPRKNVREYKYGKVTRFDPGTSVFSDIAIDSDGDVFGLDSANKRILKLTRNESPRSWTVEVSPGFLTDPTSMVALGDRIGVLDRSGRLLIFRHGQVIQSIELDSAFPDKLLAGNNELVGINYADKTLSRFLVEDHAIAALQTVKLSSLVQPVDITVMGSLYYILDAGRQQLGVWSPNLSDLTFLSYSAFAKTPTALASDGTRLVFADDSDGTFRLLESVTPVDILFEGQDLSDGLTDLYDYLYKRDLLPQRLYTPEIGDNLETLVKSQGILPTGLRPNFTSLFCKMNHLHCGIAGVLWPPFWDESMAEPFKPFKPISLPDLPLQTFVGKRYVDLETEQKQGRSATLGDVLKLNASTLSDDEVQLKLRQFNPQLEVPPSKDLTSGKFVIPTLTARTTAMIPAEESETSTLLKNLKETARIFKVAFRVAQKQTLATSGVTGQEGPGGPTTPPAYFASIHRLLPDGLPSVEVAVVDAPVNTTHQEFSNGEAASRADEYIPPGSVAVTTTTVPTSQPSKSEAGPIDHGTHTSALIAGLNVGINPQAKVKYLKFPFFPASVKADAFRIYNLSLGESEYATRNSGNGGISDVLSEWRDIIESKENFQTLFVIAAGNENKTISSSMLAASGSSSNAIVVSASDDSNPPHRWIDGMGHGGNHSLEFVQVFAPGKDIQSASFNGGYVKASGTSQATAIVAGLASLLHAAHSSWLPYQIRERIVATSDLEPWVQEADSSTGGLVNVARATADANVDYVSYRGSGDNEFTECKGTIEGSALDSQVTIQKAGNIDSVSFSVQALKRLHRNGDGTLTVIYEKQNTNRVNELDHGYNLVRYPVFVAQNAVTGLNGIAWTPEAGGKCQSSTLNLDQVVDFIARMY